MLMIRSLQLHCMAYYLLVQRFHIQAYARKTVILVWLWTSDVTDESLSRQFTETDCNH